MTIYVRPNRIQLSLVSPAALSFRFKIDLESQHKMSLANAPEKNDIVSGDTVKTEESSANSFAGGLIFCLLLALPSFLWITLDNGIWWWDQSSYGSATVRLWSSLVGASGTSDYFNVFLDSVGFSKAPGIALVGQFFVPLGQAIGSIDLALLASIVLESFLVLLMVFEIGRRLKPQNRFLPFVGCLALASTPLFYNLSRNYLVEMLQLFSVTYFYWLLVSFDRRERSENAGHLMIATSMALFAKVSTPLYCVVPGAVVLFRLLKGGFNAIFPESNKSFALWGLGVFSLAFTGIWYGYNYQHVAHLAHGTSIGQIAELYGQKAPVLEKLRIWLDILHVHLVMPLFKPFSPWLFLGAPLVYCLFKAFEKDRLFLKRVFIENSCLGLVAIAQALIVVTVLVTSIAEDPRYAFGLFPSLVVVLLSFSSQIRSSIFAGACLLLFGAQFMFLNLESFGYFADSEKKSNVVEVIQDEKLEKKELRRLSELLSPYQESGYTIILGVSYHWLNVNTANYTSEKNVLARGGKADLKPVKFRSWTLANNSKEVLGVLRGGVIPKYVFVTLESERLSEETDAPFANKINKQALNLVKKRGQKLRHDSDLGIVAYKVEDSPEQENKN